MPDDPRSRLLEEGRTNSSATTRQHKPRVELKSTMKRRAIKRFVDVLRGLCLGVGIAGIGFVVMRVYFFLSSINLPDVDVESFVEFIRALGDKEEIETSSEPCSVFSISQCLNASRR